MTHPIPRTLYSPSPLNPYYLLCLADGTGWYVPDPPRATRGGWEITPDDLEGRDVVLSNLSDVEVFALCNEEDPLLPEILRRSATRYAQIAADVGAAYEARKAPRPLSYLAGQCLPRPALDAIELSARLGHEVRLYVCKGQALRAVCDLDESAAENTDDRLFSGTLAEYPHLPWSVSIETWPDPV